MPRKDEGTVAVHGACPVGSAIGKLMDEKPKDVYHVVEFDGFVSVSGPNDCWNFR